MFDEVGGEWGEDVFVDEGSVYSVVFVDGEVFGCFGCEDVVGVVRGTFITTTTTTSAVVVARPIGAGPIGAGGGRGRSHDVW